MGFEWMSFSVKKNASAIKDSQALAQILKADTDVYAHLGTAAVDRAYAAYRAAYKAFKNEIKQAQTALGKLIGENQKTIAALKALDGRRQRADNQVSKDLADSDKVDSDETEQYYKKLLRYLADFSYDVTDLIALEESIQVNFKSLSTFLTKSKRAQE